MLAHVQVLDDSTDHITRELVDDKCLEWRERGVDCECIRRNNRKGYKAGALKEVRGFCRSTSRVEAQAKKCGCQRWC